MVSSVNMAMKIRSQPRPGVAKQCKSARSGAFSDWSAKAALLRISAMTIRNARFAERNATICRVIAVLPPRPRHHRQGRATAALNWHRTTKIFVIRAIGPLINPAGPEPIRWVYASACTTRSPISVVLRYSPPPQISRVRPPAARTLFTAASMA